MVTSNAATNNCKVEWAMNVHITMSEIDPTVDSDKMMARCMIC